MGILYYKENLPEEEAKTFLERYNAEGIKQHIREKVDQSSCEEIVKTLDLDATIGLAALIRDLDLEQSRKLTAPRN
jgi:hypothetical protein